MQRSIPAALVAACILGASCASSGGTPDRAGPPSAQAWSELTQRIARAESTPRDALRALAIAFGREVGGVAPPGEASGLRSGTGAVRLLLRHLDELTEAQRREIETLLLPGDPGSALPAVVAALPPLAGGHEVEVSIDPATTERARAIAEELGRRMGYRLRATIIGASGEPPEDEGGVAWMLPVTVTGSGADRSIEVQEDDGPLRTCLVATTLESDLAGVRVLESSLAHEVFHCIQADLVGLRDWEILPSFVAEGAAEWVGEAFVGGTAGGADWWRRYFDDAVRLVLRSYDAIGFWGQVDAHAGGGLWRSLEALHRIAGSAARLRGGALLAYLEAIRIAGEDFLDAWPAEVARRPELGGPWTLDVRDMDIRPGDRRRLVDVLVAGDGFNHDLSPTEQALWRFNLRNVPPDRVLRLDLTGFGRIAWEGTEEGAPIAGGRVERFCSGEECGCGDLASLPDQRLIVALTGSDSPARIDISLEDCAGHEVPEEAIAAGLDERGIRFTWPCPTGSDPLLQEDDLHCMASGKAWRSPRGHVALLRLVGDFHDYSLAVLLDGPEELPPDIPVRPTGGEGPWRLLDVASAHEIPEAWNARLGPSFGPVTTVCTRHDNNRCVQTSRTRD